MPLEPGFLVNERQDQLNVALKSYLIPFPNTGTLLNSIDKTFDNFTDYALKWQLGK